MIPDKPLEYDETLWPVFSFAGGPTQLPRTVLRQIDKNFLNYNGLGLSILEISDKSKEFKEIVDQATGDLREMYNLPPDFKIYFGSGGATLIFESLVYNLLQDKKCVSYANTGHWSEKAVKEANFLSKGTRIINKVHINCTTQTNEEGLQYIPPLEEWDFNDESAFLHYCDNETAEGIEFQFTPKYKDQVLITDVSSNFLTRHMDWNKLDILYSHGQKNVGIAGSSILIMRDHLISKDKMAITPYFCDFQVMQEHNGFQSTAPIMPIYVNSLMFRYIKETGGPTFWDQHSKYRSGKIYKVIDESHGFYRCPIVKSQRSRISLVFDLAKPELQQKFFDDAKLENIIEIKGHRSRGGCRVCLYVPVSDIGIDRLADFMQRFAELHS